MFKDKLVREAMERLAKRRAANTKAGVVRKTKANPKKDVAVDQFMRAKGELKYANRYGFTKANPRKKLENKVKKSENKLKKIVEEEGGTYSPRDYFNKGGAVNSIKSCGLAVRGHGAVIK